MLYYLQDFITGAVLLIDQDAHLVNNLKAGLLDCEVFVTGGYGTAVNSLRTHADKQHNLTGIKFSNLARTEVEEFSLENFPEIAKKQQLVKIRKIAFVALLQCANQYRAKNAHGFHPTDAVVIDRALTDSNRIDEYAAMMGMSPFFAQQELAMISDTVFVDWFRVFTICSFWKKHINQADTLEQINTLLPKIRESFYSAGVADV